VQLEPHHPDPLTSWAQVALWQRNTRKALGLLQRALQLDPAGGDAYRLRAGADMALGHREAALADWRRALADPQAAQAGATAAQLALAEASWARQRCQAVRDARFALVQGAAPNLTLLQEILHVDGPRCAGSAGD
jgi:tetratricopeptide (TPR) repeat protein